MGLCAPSYNPDDVKFRKKRKKYMLDDDQKKVIREQLGNRLTSLESIKTTLTSCVASYGSSLHKVIEEINQIENVLLDLKSNDE